MNDESKDPRVELASHAPNAICQALAHLACLEHKIKAITGKTCTGKPTWRDKNSDVKMPKLYAIHGVGQSCPIHGTPHPGKHRIRTYIGSKDTAIREATTAMDRHKRLLNLTSEANNALESLGFAMYYLDYFFAALEYTIPPETTTTKQMVTRETSSGS